MSGFGGGGGVDDGRDQGAEKAGTGQEEPF
jgi:hypothetical protein